MVEREFKISERRRWLFYTSAGDRTPSLSSGNSNPDRKKRLKEPHPEVKLDDITPYTKLATGVTGAEIRRRFESPNDGGWMKWRLGRTMGMAIMNTSNSHHEPKRWKHHWTWMVDYGRPTEYDRPLYFHPVACSFFFFFFPRLISAAADWMPVILPHMVWP